MAVGVAPPCLPLTEGNHGGIAPTQSSYSAMPNFIGTQWDDRSQLTSYDSAVNNCRSSASESNEISNDLAFSNLEPASSPTTT